MSAFDFPTRAKVQRTSAWIGEAALMFGAILALDYALRPGFALLDATPHAFWVPVLLIALGRGTGPGLATAAAAIALGWWHGWPAVSGTVDFYGRMLSSWKEPVLWIAAAFVAGRFNERHLEQRQILEGRTREAEAQRQAVADHAIELRAHIARLEAAITAGPATASRPAPAQDIRIPQPQKPVASARPAAAPAVSNRSLLGMVADDV